MSHTHHHVANIDSILDKLRAHGMRITATRKRLTSVLCDAGTPLSIEAIHQRLGPKSFDLVTLYRCLDAFEEVGVVQVVRDEHGKALYELIDADHGHHHHVICRNCGKIECLDHCAIAPFEAAAKRLGYDDLAHRLELYGVCADCRT
ncbi:Fur family transcriptional regulator [Cerasicoccus fimbriatus]|uniref:Fur family transcriptional regulator n=1 Tax=Cerasicoccus fimbriatus TaxID=3014554 RepID=UPI0022B46DFF|nr:Fur family transcriptional regulator [Cerasicoccus sp. TK19100]